jgi:hypothetical protein
LQIISKTPKELIKIYHFSLLSFACAKESFDKLRIESQKKSTPAMIPIAIGTAIAGRLD